MGDQNVHDWQELSRQTVYRSPYNTIEKIRFRLPAGEEREFEVRNEKPLAFIVALTPENKVVLAKQFRPGPKRVIWEIPGGFINADESPEQAARRELLEETGFDGDMQLIGQYWFDGYSTCRPYCFAATNCRKVQEPKLDSGEYIEAKIVDLKEFRRLLREGQLTDMEAGYMALDHLGHLGCT